MISTQIPSLLDYSSGQHVRQMSESVTRMLMGLYMTERQQGDKPIDFGNPKASFPEEMHPLFDEMFPKIFLARLGVLSPNTKITPGVAIFFIAISNTPGDLVMWAFALHRLCHELGGKTVTMSEIMTNRFPWGFPTEESRGECWDAQKRHERPERKPGEPLVSDNWLDAAEAWVLEPVAGGEPSSEESPEGPQEESVGDVAE